MTFPHTHQFYNDSFASSNFSVGTFIELMLFSENEQCKTPQSSHLTLSATFLLKTCSHYQTSLRASLIFFSSELSFVVGKNDSSLLHDKYFIINNVRSFRW